VILNHSSISFNEFAGIGQDLEGASGLAIISLALVLIQDTNYSNSCPFVGVVRSNLRQLSEAANLDPACGLLLKSL
jgi:hypothetical protein